MERKHKLELVIVASLSIIIVVLAHIALGFMNNLERMVVRPLIYILLVTTPFISSNIIKRPIGTLGFKKDNILKQVVAGLIVFMLIALPFTIAIILLGDNKGLLLDSPIKDFGKIIYFIILFIVFVGMGEETLFRGYFLERFNKLTNSKVMAIVLSSVFFGIYHFPGGQDFVQVLGAIVLGAIYAVMMFKLKNCTTLSVGIAHGLHNVYILVLSCVLL